MKTTTRPAILHDLPTLLRFEQGVVEYERAFDSTLKAKDVSYYDLSKLIQSKKSEVLVVEANGKIIASGYARIEKAKDYHQHQQYAYLGFMYVEPEFRGMGMNKLIVDGLFAWAKKKGILEIRLDVYAENEAAIRAYEKVGFSKHMVEMRLGL